MTQKNEQNKGIFNGVFLGYFILLLHVLLIFGLGFAVVMIKGIYDLRWIIFTCGVLLIGGSAYLIYRKMKTSNKTFSEMMNNPALQDRTLEISLFGGMASMKLGHRNDQTKVIEADTVDEIRQLEAPPSQVKELGQLVKMLEDDLITREEFDRLKKGMIEK